MKFVRPIFHISSARWTAIITFIVLGIILYFIVSISWHNTIQPRGIVIHHSAVPIQIAANASGINMIHKLRGFGAFYWGRRYYIGYHYVILPDGEIQSGRPEHLRGEHTRNFNDYIGICIIGDFSSQDNVKGMLSSKAPTEIQMKALLELITKLRLKYRIPSDKVFLHRELNSKTECPGDRFPVVELRYALGHAAQDNMLPQVQ
jgi:hypothetical protein